MPARSVQSCSAGFTVSASTTTASTTSATSTTSTTSATSTTSTTSGTTLAATPTTLTGSISLALARKTFRSDIAERSFHRVWLRFRRALVCSLGGVALIAAITSVCPTAHAGLSRRKGAARLVRRAASSRGTLCLAAFAARATGTPTPAPIARRTVARSRIAPVTHPPVRRTGSG